MNMINSVLEEIFLQVKEKVNNGKIADYIPELSLVDPNSFGMAMTTVDGYQYRFGDYDLPFTIQSISKAFIYGMALDAHGADKVYDKISVEPSGDAFNSISLYPDTGRPYNPMINAGAIAATGLLKETYGSKTFKEILKVFSNYAASKLKVNNDVYKSESKTGHRNRAIAHLLRNFNIIEDEVSETVDDYFKQCSIEVSCDQLSIMGATLANNGVNPITNNQAISQKHIPKVLSVMSTCGMYDYSGEWIYNIGLPAKSGVSGGVLAVLPGQLSFAVYSPLLDEKGNSILGVELCQRIADTFSLHLYKTPRQSQQVIRKHLTMKTARSKLKRTPFEDQLITEQGGNVHLMELQGDLNFASSEIFLRQIPNDLQMLILNMRKCSRIDEASILLIKKLKQSFIAEDKVLYVTNYQHLTTLANHPESDMSYFKFTRIEEALVWCENDLLNKRGYQPSTKPFDLSNQLLLQGLSKVELDLLEDEIRLKEFREGDLVLERGNRATSIYFIESGKVYIIGTNDDNKDFLLAHLSAGNCFGEMALLEDKVRSANVIAQNDVKCFLLDFETLEKPEFSSIKLIITTNLAKTLSERLRVANREIASFM